MIGNETRYFYGSTKIDIVVRMPPNFEFVCSVINKVIDNTTATSKRVLIDGPVANKSLITMPHISAKVL